MGHRIQVYTADHALNTQSASSVHTPEVGPGSVCITLWAGSRDCPSHSFRSRKEGLEQKAGPDKLPCPHSGARFQGVRLMPSPRFVFPGGPFCLEVSWLPSSFCYPYTTSNAIFTMSPLLTLSWKMDPGKSVKGEPNFWNGLWKEKANIAVCQLFFGRM